MDNRVRRVANSWHYHGRYPDMRESTRGFAQTQFASVDSSVAMGHAKNRTAGNTIVVAKHIPSRNDFPASFLENLGLIVAQELFRGVVPGQDATFPVHSECRIPSAFHQIRSLQGTTLLRPFGSLAI